MAAEVSCRDIVLTSGNVRDNSRKEKTFPKPICSGTSLFMTIECSQSVHSIVQSVIGIALCRMSGISLTQQLASLRIYASSAAARSSIVRTAATASGSVCQISYSLIPGIPIKTSGLR